jgi:hypothetical protein
METSAMYIFHWWGNVWQIGDDSDLLFMLIVKLVLSAIVLAIGLGLLGFWLGWKLIAWNPAVGLPVVGGLIALGVVLAAAG